MEETEESGLGSFGYETRNWGKPDSLQRLLIVLGCNLCTFLPKCILRQMLAEQATSHSFIVYNHQPEQESYFIILNSHTHFNLILVLAVVNEF